MWITLRADNQFILFIIAIGQRAKSSEESQRCTFITRWLNMEPLLTQRSECVRANWALGKNQSPVAGIKSHGAERRARIMVSGLCNCKRSHRAHFSLSLYFIFILISIWRSWRWTHENFLKTLHDQHFGPLQYFRINLHFWKCCFFRLLICHKHTLWLATSLLRA